MGYDIGIGQKGQFPSKYSSTGYVEFKYDEPAEDYSDTLSYNGHTGAKLFPLLGIEVVDGQGECHVTQDFLQRCTYVIHGMSDEAITEFTCARNAMLDDLVGELRGAGANFNYVGTDADTVKGLKRRTMQVMRLALTARRRHGDSAYLLIS